MGQCIIMWLLKLLEIFTIFTVQFAPIVVDTGLQIWNGVTINTMEFKRNLEWYGNSTVESGSTNYDDSNGSYSDDEYINSNNENSTKRMKRDSPCGENENDILRCMSSHGDGGTFDPDEDGVKTDIDIGVRSNFITIYIS